jgi:hypothetical protein
LIVARKDLVTFSTSKANETNLFLNSVKHCLVGYSFLLRVRTEGRFSILVIVVEKFFMYAKWEIPLGYGWWKTRTEQQC